MIIYSTTLEGEMYLNYEHHRQQTLDVKYVVVGIMFVRSDRISSLYIVSNV